MVLPNAAFCGTLFPPVTLKATASANYRFVGWGRNEGNAIKYLSEYFIGQIPENPYIEDPRDIRTLSVSPNGDLLGGNMNREDVLKIIENNMWVIFFNHLI